MPNLDEIKARRDAITLGEWTLDTSRGCFNVIRTETNLISVDITMDEDATFIANVPTDIDWLIQEVERLRAEKTQAEAERDVLLHELLKETHSHLCEDPERPCPFDEETEGKCCSNECANVDPETCWLKYAQQQAEEKGV